MTRASDFGVRVRGAGGAGTKTHSCPLGGAVGGGGGQLRSALRPRAIGDIASHPELSPVSTCVRFTEERFLVAGAVGVVVGAGHAEQRLEVDGLEKGGEEMETIVK